MSKRLTVQERRNIVNKVVAAAFAKRESDQKEAGFELARRIRDSHMKPEEIAAIDALPAKFFSADGYITGCDPENSRRYWSLETRALRIPFFFVHKTVLVEDKALLADLEAWSKLNAEIATEKQEFTQKTGGVVHAFTSAVKLLEHWPTLRELMGENFFADNAPPQVPATTVNELDAVLKANLPFEPVQVAA